MKTRFKSVFGEFLRRRDYKVIFVGSADKRSRPNTAPKLLVAIEKPNFLYFLDYRFTRSYRNLIRNPRASAALMDDGTFTGLRLSGPCRPLGPGPEFDRVREEWERKLNRYLASRIVERMMGNRDAGLAEMGLPKDFVIMKIAAGEAALVKPDRVFRGSF